MKNITNKKGFTLMELIVVVTIIWVIVSVAATRIMNSTWEDDIYVDNAFWKIKQHLADYKIDHWEFPSSSPNSDSAKESGCNVSWYNSLIECFVLLWYLNEWDKEYNSLLKHPSNGKKNEEWEEFAFMYWVGANNNVYALRSLASKQKGKDLVAKDGSSDAEGWFRYIEVTSDNYSSEEHNITVNK